jgi:alpha/beta superfamily hydrolase
MTGLRARQREAQATGRRDYQPRMIAGADHFFEGQEQVLIKDITHWLGLLTEPSR